MRNRFIINCLLFVTICFFSISMHNIIVKAVDEFPETIYVGSSGLIKYDGGGNIFKKSYTTDNSHSGKAYCSSFWASAPGENSDTRIRCTKEKWPNNHNQYAAAIGAIVNAARSSDGSTTWYNYYYAELAINRFLYLNITPKNDIYNYAPYTIINSSKFKDYYNKAQAAYDEYSAQSKLEIKVGTPKFSDNKITSNISCFKDGIQIDCPKDIAVTIKIGNNGYKVSKENGNTKTLTVSANVTNLNAGTYTATVFASSTKNFVLAQRYNCGNAQKMVPNLLKPVNITKSGKSSTELKIPKADPPTCETELKEGKNRAELYKTYKKNGLLNINSPSCDNVTDNSVNFTCGESSIKISTIATVSKLSDDSSFGYVYCTYNYKVNSPIFEDSSAIEQSLIYKISQSMTQDNKVESNLNVDISIVCNAVPFKDKTIEQHISLKTLLPIITVDIFGTSYSAKPQIKDSNLAVSSNLKKISKTDITDILYKYTGSTNQQFSILGRVNYAFDDYKIDRSSHTIVKASDCKDKCELNGIDIGNGIPVPTGSNSGKSTIHINIKDLAESKKCDYTINKLGSKEQLLFRTIDTNNPFLNKDGGLRYTGTNWCKTEDSQDTGKIIENIGDDISTNIFNKTGRLLGDVDGSATDLTRENGEPAITDNDVDLIRAYVQNMSSLTDDEKNDIRIYGDINQDGSITEDDADILSQELTNYFISDVTSCGSTNSSENDCYRYNLKNIAGDINGDYNVDDEDAKMIQGYIAGTQSLTESQIESADVDGDGKVRMDDVTYLQMSNYTFQKGDVNLDGKVDQNDFNMLNSYIFSSNANNANNEIDSYTLVNADIDGNKQVNIYDLVRFRDYFIASAYDFNEINSGSDSSNEVDARAYAQSYCNAYTTKNKNNNSVSINSTVEKYITNRPNSDGKKNSLSNDKAEPLYSFTLTPDNIKKIREYNKGTSYDDFELTCTNNECVSTFVKNVFGNESYAFKSSGLCKDKSIKNQFCNVSALLSS